MCAGISTSWWIAPTQIYQTISLLEYAPYRREKTVEQRNHRDFLAKHNAQVLPGVQYPDEYCYELITYTFRLQYLKDTVLCGQLSDASVTPMQQCLLNNYQTLFCSLLKDDQFIRNVLNIIRAGACSNDKDLEQNVKFCLNFIVELVFRVRSMLYLRSEFLRKFEDTGLYEVLTLVLSPPEVTPTSKYKLWLATVELFTGFIGRVPCIDPLNGFRTYICNWIQCRNFDTNQESNLLERLTYGFTVEEELNRGLIIQLYHLLTILLKCFDSPLEFHQEDVLYAKVVDYFLKDLGQLVLSAINRKWSPGSVQSEQTSVHQKTFCVELFISLVKCKEVQMREFIQTLPVIESIAGLIECYPLKKYSVAQQHKECYTSKCLPIPTKGKRRHFTLTITAVRFLKVCILKTTDPVFTKCIISQQLMKPIIECFIVNQPKDNLLSATCRSLLETIIINNNKGLVASIALNEYDMREDLDLLARNIFKKIGRLDSTNQSNRSLSDHGTLDGLESKQISPHLPTLPTPILPVHSAWQKCESEEEQFFSEDEKENITDASFVRPSRVFQPPRRSSEPELDLLVHKMAKKEIPCQLSTTTSPGTESLSSLIKPKKKGIFSFTFISKKKRSLSVIAKDETKKKKQRVGSDLLVSGSG